MNKTGRTIVQEFKDGASMEHISLDWLVPRDTVEALVRIALKAQDKKKGKA